MLKPCWKSSHMRRGLRSALSAAMPVSSLVLRERLLRCSSRLPLCHPAERWWWATRADCHAPPLAAERYSALRNRRVACSRSSSCQFLAQTTYLYTSVKQSPKALLERESERVKGVELDTDHPAAAPANNPL